MNLPVESKVSACAGLLTEISGATITKCLSSTSMVSIPMRMPHIFVEVPVAPCIRNVFVVYVRISDFRLVADRCAPVSTTGPDVGRCMDTC